MPVIVDAPCFCNGTNAVCVKCDGTGVVHKIGCRRCKGTGYNEGVAAAGKCYDCRGQKYRDIDNGALNDSLTDFEL